MLGDAAICHMKLSVCHLLLSWCFSEGSVDCCGLRLQFSCGYFIVDITMIVSFYPILGGYEFVSLSYLISFILLNFLRKNINMICIGFWETLLFVWAIFIQLLISSRLWKMMVVPNILFASLHHGCSLVARSFIIWCQWYHWFYPCIVDMLTCTCTLFFCRS